MPPLGMEYAGKTAVIIGASSGIGEALARELHRAGWRLGLLARRTGRLETLAAELGGGVSSGYIDVSKNDRVNCFEAMMADLGDVDLVIFSVGCGYFNAEDDGPDLETVSVNILGFMALAKSAFRYFAKRGQGQLAVITSVVALRGNGEATVYAASKAFQSNYVDGLRESAQQLKLPITITELQPGFVDTAMMKTKVPLSPFMRKLLVCDASTAARQMIRAITRKRKHAYVTRRYAGIALLLKLLPRPGR